MGEFLGFAYYAEVPVVLFDIQRVGPSTGMPTRTQQSDVLSCAYASHGDTKHILLFPANPKECFEMSVKAFDLADRFQTPVFVMSDLDLGMNEWMVDPLEWSGDYVPDRGKVLLHDDLEKMVQAKEPFYRYFDKDGDGVVTRTYPGAHPKLGSFFTRGSGHDRFGRYTEDAADYQDNMDRLRRKFDTAKAYVPEAEIKINDAQKSVGVVYYGTTAEPMAEVLQMLSKKHPHMNLCRIRAFPFTKKVEEFLADHQKIVIVEQNRDQQLAALIRIETGTDPKKMCPVTAYSGLPPSAVELTEKISEVLS
jgi:2-oxoglutarate ferredoxin oxidoreductase subunit alpha